MSPRSGPAAGVVGHLDLGAEDLDTGAEGARRAVLSISSAGIERRSTTAARRPRGRSCRPDRWPGRGPPVSGMSSLTTSSIWSVDRSWGRSACRTPPPASSGSASTASTSARAAERDERVVVDRGAGLSARSTGRSMTRAWTRCGRRRLGRSRSRTATGSHWSGLDGRDHAFELVGPAAVPVGDLAHDPSPCYPG